jgi:2-methylisocitrate lyase-like PEP mutase family enzyme
MTLDGKAGLFLSLHRADRPLLQPNAWDAGSARLLAALGFEAIATTSSGFAATLGRTDGSVSADEKLAHCRLLAGAVDVPVAADTENGFADSPEDVGAFVTAAAATGLAGCSIEDFTGDRREPIYDAGLARDRVAAAAEAAHRGPVHLALTARCENLLHGRDLPDAIARIQTYQEAGADVLFVPGIRSAEDIRAFVSSVDLPVNVLGSPGCPTVAELGELGVCRVSIGGSFTWAALAGMIDAATELRDHGTYGFGEKVAAVRGLIGEAMSSGA